jgi:hypothetical protein
MTAFPQTFNLVSTAPSTGSFATAPTALAGLNYSVVFQDDFTSASTIATTSAPTTGFNWYFGDGASTPTSNYWNVNGTQLASAIGNGNSGGGPNPSSAGGIIKFINATVGYNDTLQSVPKSISDNNGSGFYAQSFIHAYFEAYIQFNPANAVSGGWPAWWLRTNGGQGTAVPYPELDIMEWIAAESGQQTYGTLNSWTATNTVTNQQYYYGNADANWHQYAAWWQSTGTNTGKVTFFMDNVAIAGNSNIPTGAGAAPYANTQEGRYMYPVLGTGPGTPMFVDWVRVWQAN